MWSWLLGLRKCFGTTREASPDPEGIPEPSRDSETSVRNALDSAQARANLEPSNQDAGTPGKGRQAPRSILDASSTPQLKDAAAVPSMRASPLAIPSPALPSSPAARWSPSPSGSPASKQRSKVGRQQLVRGSPGKEKAAQRTYSAQHLNTARIAKVTRGNSQSSPEKSGSSSSADGVRRRTPASRKSPDRRAGSPRGRATPGTAGRGRGSQRPSRLSVQTPAQPAGSAHGFASLEEQPLKGGNTPFDVRLERQLKAAQETGTERKDAQSQTQPEWTASVLLQRDEKDLSNAADLSSSLRHHGPSTPAETVTGPSSPPRPGKENTAGMPSPKLAEPKAHAVAESKVSDSDMVLKPQMRVRLPSTDTSFVRAIAQDSNQEQASTLSTPSPTFVPRFLMNTNDSYGSPNVVGVENLHTQYREDKRLRVHETPFEERVERFIETERAWKESRLSQQGSEPLS